LELSDIREIVLDKKFAMKPTISIYGEGRRLLQKKVCKPNEADDIFYKMMMKLNEFLIERENQCS
jgi:hypothetical protein